MDLNDGLPYRSASAHVILLTVFFSLSMFLCLVSAWSNFSEIQLLEDVRSGLEIAEASAVINDSRQGLIALAQLGLFVALVITYCMWVYRANRNAHALGAQDMRFTPGWCVGWFFIPIMWLFKPYQAVQEIWKASDPDTSRPWQEGDDAPAIKSWWAFWTISSILSHLAGRAAMGAEALNEMIRADWVMFVSDVIDIPSALLAMIVVRGIHARQERKNNAVPPPLEDVMQVWPAQMRTDPSSVQTMAPPKLY